MRKIFAFFFLTFVLGLKPAIYANAEEEQPTFFFDLSVDGEETQEVHTGDIITVMLKLHRTDQTEPYTMYAMQDEIRYDSQFFEIIEENTVLADGVVCTDIAMVDEHREFYMNFLSMSGGTKWDNDTFIGSFQLRVLGNSGVSKITNQDYLVSLQDGMGSYQCEANELTIVLSTDCIVQFMTTGGSQIPDQIVQYGEKIIQPENPMREGYTFEGWYTDIHLSEKWDFEQDVVQENMSLYAKWVISESENTERIPLFKIILWILLIIILLLIIYNIRKYKEKKI